METQPKFLTLTLLLFETTDGERTITDEVAEKFLCLFPPESPWRASIHRVGVVDSKGGNAESGGHYEVCWTFSLTQNNTFILPHHLSFCCPFAVSSVWLHGYRDDVCPHQPSVPSLDPAISFSAQIPCTLAQVNNTG